MGLWSFFIFFVFVFSSVIRIDCSIQSFLPNEKYSSVGPNHRQNNERGVGLGIPPLFLHPQKSENHDISDNNSKESGIVSNLDKPCFIPVSNAIAQSTVIKENEEKHYSNNADLSQGKCLNARGLFPTNYCNTFLNCWDGFALEQTCPDNLLFNTAGYCDYPSNVNCQKRILQANSFDLPQKKFFQDNNVVNIDTAASLKLYPTPSFLNNKNDYDKQQYKTMLPDKQPPLVPENNQKRDNLESKCFQPRGQFPSEYCHKYINCWDGFVTEEECPKGLLFSYKGYCDYPANVECGLRSFPGTLNISPECPEMNGVFIDQTNCKKYFVCGLGNVIAKYDCPEGLYFNQAIGVCDYANNVACEKS